MHALVEELPDEDQWPLFLWSGRFQCRLEDGREREFESLETAVDWAREHASHVSIDFEDKRYELPLPADVLARAAIGPRRRRGEEWLDRTPADPLIEWVVELEVHPPDLEGEGPARDRQDAISAAAVDALREAGFDDVQMSTGELDAGLADIAAQTAGRVGDVGWTTPHSLAYEITASTFASTRRQAIDHAVQVAADAVQRQVGASVWRHTTDEPMYLAWGVSAGARPR